jgi:transporter family protein
MKAWMLPTLGVFICWGLWGFLPKITVKYINPKSAVIFEVLGGIVLAFIVTVVLKYQIATHPMGIFLAIVTGLVGFLGSLFFLYAVKNGPINVVVTLSALYPVLSIALAILILNEPITLKQGIGIIFALVAMVLVGL